MRSASSASSITNHSRLGQLVGKVFDRSVYTLRTGYWKTRERVCPDFPDENFVNHFKAYRFAAQFCPGRRVLDVGCGTGYGTAHLAEAAKNAVGIDRSRQAIRYARARFRGANLQFLKMDAESISLPGASFDFIISTENFEHLRDHRANLRGMSRTLSNSGLILIATPNPEMFVGVDSPYHTHEFTFGELSAIVQEFFLECQICENSLAPSTEAGVGARNQRQRRGMLGVDLASRPALWGESVDTRWLSNTHSFICFARGPRRS